MSDWEVGSTWEHRRTDGSGVADVVGTVLEAVPPSRLVMTFEPPGAEPVQEAARVTFTIEPHEQIVRLTVIHENLADQADYEAASAGWPAVLANLKRDAWPLLRSREKRAKAEPTRRRLLREALIASPRRGRRTRRYRSSCAARRDPVNVVLRADCNDRRDRSEYARATSPLSGGVSGALR